MCHVYLGSHYSHFWWGWNEMGNPFMAGLTMVLEDLVARWRSVGLGQKQLPLFLLHRRSGLSAGLFFFPAIIWYFLKPHLLYHVSPKPLLILFINPWPNLDTIQKVCFPSEGINLRVFLRFNASGTLQWAFISPRKETANTVTWTLWSWDHWSGGYLHAWTPRHFTMGRTAGSS